MVSEENDFSLWVWGGKDVRAVLCINCPYAQVPVGKHAQRTGDLKQVCEKHCLTSLDLLTSSTAPPPSLPLALQAESAGAP